MGHFIAIICTLQIQAKRPAVKTAALKAQAGTGAKSSGLRITFKPADLGKTTDKIMAAQVCLIVLGVVYLARGICCPDTGPAICTLSCAHDTDACMFDSDSRSAQ